MRFLEVQPALFAALLSPPADRSAFAPRRSERISNRENRGRYFCGGGSVVHGVRLDLHRDRPASIPKAAALLRPPKKMLRAPPRERPRPTPELKRGIARPGVDPAEAAVL